MPTHRCRASLQANTHTSYISEMWFDMYLENRDPFPLNVTPQLTWKDDDDPDKNEQVRRWPQSCRVVMALGLLQ